MPMRAPEVALAHRACFALLAALLPGCAGFTTTNIASAEDEAKARGFRYYESAPFLLVHLDAKGSPTTEVLYLPDTTRKRSIQPYAYGASNKATLTFAEGRLTQSKAVVDETVLPSAVLSALEKIALARMKILREEPPKAAPSLHLFRIVKEGDQWGLAGGQALPAGHQGGKP